MFFVSSLFFSKDESLLKKKVPQKKITPTILKKQCLLQFCERDVEINNILLENKIDYIIVGGGVNGLIIGNLLALESKKVIILDAHRKKLGGMMHNFKKKECEFNSWFHTFNDFGKDGIPRKIIDFLTENKVDFEKYNVYDEIFIGTNRKNVKKFKISSFLQLRSSLCREFPNEREKIFEYFDLMDLIYKEKLEVRKMYQSRKLYDEKVNAGVDSYIQTFANLFRAKNFEKYLNVSLGNILDDFFNHKDLKAILGYGNSYFLATPDEIPFSIYVMYFVSHLKGGVYFASEGTGQISSHLVNSLTKLGAGCFCNAKVVKILTDEKEKKAKGVVLEDGTEILCKNVISTIGLFNTSKLIPESSGYFLTRQICKFPPTHSEKCSFFLGFDKRYKELKLPLHNVVLCPSVKCILNSELNENVFGPVHCYFSSNFVTEREKLDPNIKSKIVLECEINPELFNHGFDVENYAKDKKYNRIKVEISRTVMKIFFTFFPELKDRLIMIEVGTPLTSKKYGNRKNSINFGFTKDRFYLNPKTVYSNLIVSGEDCSYLGGFNGSVFNAIHTVERLLDKNYINDLL